MAGPRINLIFSMDTSEFQRNLRQVERQLGNFGKRMQDVGSTLTTNLTLPLVAVGGAAVKAFADMEKLSKGMVAIMGSTQAASNEFEKLREVARLPGLGLKEAVQGSINLQAVGLSADEARSTLLGFGKALAATGKGRVELEAIQYQLTQMISKNKILAEDYKVIQSNLPLMAKGMMMAFGTNNIEAVRETGISAKEFALRLSNALSNMEETQNVTGGLANAFENFTDSLFIAGNQIGQTISETFNLEEVLRTLSKAVESIADGFASLSPTTQKVIVIFGAFVAAIGPVLFAIGAFSKVAALASAGAIALGKAWVFMTGPIGLTIAAIGAVVAALTILYVKSESVRKVINAIGSTFSELITIMKEGAAGIIEGFGLLLEGEFVKGGKKIQEGLKKVNPISAAFAEGGRLRDAFNKGFADNTNYLAGVQKQFEQATSGFKAAETPTSSLGGGGGPEIEIKAKVNEKSINLIGNSLKQIRTLAEATLPTFDKLRISLAKIEEVRSPFDRFNESFAKFEEGLTIIDDKAKIFGTTVGDVLAQKLALARGELEKTIEVFPLGSEQVERATAAYQDAQNQFDNFTQSTSRLKSMQEALAGGISQAGSIISSALEDQALSFKSMARAVLEAARAIIKAYIQEGVAGIIKNILAGPTGKALGPVAIAVAGAAGAVAASIFSAALNKIAPPRLARGGVTTGETLAVVGDNPSGKEAIIPFERMGEFLNMAGGGGTRVFGQFEVRGQDLVLVLDRAQQSKARVR